MIQITNILVLLEMAFSSCSSHKGGKSKSGTKRENVWHAMNDIIMYDRKETRRATTKNNNDDK